MSTPNDCVKSDEGQTTSKWTAERDLQLWTHFADVGRTDKTTMVTVTSWLLGFSATIIGYIITQLFPPDSVTPGRSLKAICLALLGIVVSGVAWYVVVLYGGYSNWNWAKADEIALRNGWRDLVRKPDGAPSERQYPGKDKVSYLAREAEKFSEPHDHKTELAPVFKTFARLACLAALTHLILLIWSVVP